jgi:competence protein ComEC
MNVQIYSHLKKVFTFFSLVLTLLCFITACAPSSTIAPLRIKNDLTVHFIDIGLGDSIFIVLPSGENMLIDAGSPSEGTKAARYLKSLGIRTIDHMILTHPDDDHIGGVFNILSEFRVRKIYDNGFSNFGSNIYRDYVKKVRQDLAKYNILQAGEHILSEDVTIEVLNPLMPPSGNTNQDSIVLKLIYGDIKILLTGDLGHLGERRLLQNGTDLASTILKVGHHGEKDACSAEFLEHVQPEIAVISVSRVNRYARPKPEVLQRLEKAGITIYRTDMHGTITLRTRGKTYTVKSEK